MKKSLSLCLVASVMSLTGLMVAPGPAYADGSGCGPLVGTEPQTIGVLGKTVHVPGVKAQYCDTFYGDTNFTHIPNWVTPRVQPGTCDPSAYDPACLTVFLDTLPFFGFSNVTVTVYVDGVAQPPISVDIPRYPVATGGSYCVLSVGYRAAPTKPCIVFYDMGQ
jgi:hypothetical protein